MSAETYDGARSRRAFLQTLAGTAGVIEGAEREELARHLVAAKYQGWSAGRPMSSWASGSLPVEVAFD